MKRIKKLKLSKQTIAVLSGESLRKAQGAIQTAVNTLVDEMCTTGGTGGGGQDQTVQYACPSEGCWTSTCVSAPCGTGND